jgi:hypothetical protein
MIQLTKPQAIAIINQKKLSKYKFFLFSKNIFFGCCSKFIYIVREEKKN